MNTIKRNVREVIATNKIKNYNQFFNQMTWGGIVEGTNIYELNQQSFADAKNMYVEDGSLLSRKPLQVDKSLPEYAVPPAHKLIEILSLEEFTVYVSEYYYTDIFAESHTKYHVTIDGSDETTLDIEDSDYKLATISHYIICFNNAPGAQVYDINNPSKGWQNLTDLADVPVIKRTVGSVITEYPKNNFTNAYKEEYIWSNTSQPLLPNGDGDVELNTPRQSLKLTIPETNKLPEYRIVRPLNYSGPEGGILSVAGDIICIAYEDYFMLSYNNGETFDKILYPDLGEYNFCEIASVSQDGAYFFFVAENAVYKYYIGNDPTVESGWQKIYLNEDPNLTLSSIGSDPNAENPKGIYNACKFINGDTFAFFMKLTGGTFTPGLYLYFRGPGLKRAGVNYLDKYLDFIKIGDRRSIDWNLLLNGELQSESNATTKVYYENIFKQSFKDSIQIIARGDLTYITCIVPYNDKLDSSIENHFVGSAIYFIPPIPKTTNTNSEISGPYLLDGFYGALQITGLGDSSYNLNALVRPLITDDQSDSWKAHPVTIIPVKYNDYSILENATISVSNTGTEIVPQLFKHFLSYPFRLSNGYIYLNNIWLRGSENVYRLPKEIGIVNEQNFDYIVVNDDYFYIKNRDTIWTNKLTDNDIVTITYIYKSEGDYFTEVPTLTYSDTELYMAFKNNLRITKNTYDGLDVYFNLPSINDQGFISDIGAMVNISTTELALFFKNKIVICSKVEDETFGYRYDYNNTRLSVGVRLGDSVINTLEGQYTVFPTRRGLAFMSYEQFVATTEQTLSYISDPIKDRWTKFYDASDKINIIQWREYLVFSNGTKNILLLNLTQGNMSWWHWELPVIPTMFITDQVELKIISETLYVFKDHESYYDFPKTLRAKRIEWFTQSQPLHMSAPNYYKSIRQLIFQLVQTTPYKTSIVAQVKLYRKKLTIREPEVISFKVEEFRTFVKRFNYWKINEIQWALGDDAETVTPAQLKLNGVTVKYEIGSEVR